MIRRSIENLITEARHSGTTTVEALESAINTATDGGLDKIAEAAKELRYTMLLKTIDAAHAIKLSAENIRHQNATPSTKESIIHDLHIAQLNIEYQYNKVAAFAKKTATFGVNGEDSDVAQTDSQGVLVDSSSASSSSSSSSSSSTLVNSDQQRQEINMQQTLLNDVKTQMLDNNILTLQTEQDSRIAKDAVVTHTADTMPTTSSSSSSSSSSSNSSAAVNSPEALVDSSGTNNSQVTHIVHSLSSLAITTSTNPSGINEAVSHIGDSDTNNSSNTSD